MSELGDLECPVCLQEYTETGEFVPRILPCRDTVFERCIKRLLGDGSTLKCSVDRRKFYAEKRFLTFQQNKYILSQLKKKRKQKKSTLQNCKTYALVLNLYCYSCQKDICSMCLSENHRRHDVVDINSLKKKKCEDILKSANQLDEHLKEDMNELVKMKKELANDAETCINSIIIQKLAAMLLFDRMVDDVKRHQTKTNSTIDELISEINKNITTIRQTTNDTDSELMTLEIISKKKEIIKEIKDNVPKISPERKSFNSLKYVLNDMKQIERVCGKIIKVKKQVQFKTLDKDKESKTPATDRPQPTCTDFVDRPKRLPRYSSSAFRLLCGTPEPKNLKYSRYLDVRDQDTTHKHQEETNSIQNSHLAYESSAYSDSCRMQPRKVWDSNYDNSSDSDRFFTDCDNLV